MFWKEFLVVHVIRGREFVAKHYLTGSGLEQAHPHIEASAITEYEDSLAHYGLAPCVKDLKIAPDRGFWVGGLEPGADDQGAQQEKTREAFGQEVPHNPWQ
jgi:hypothetical protein